MNKITNKKIEDAFLDYYLEADKDTIEEILHDDLIDIEEYKKKRKKLLFLINSRAKKQANNIMIERVLNYFQDGIQKNTTKPIAYLKQLISDNHAVALYHNFDTLSKDDILSIIKDKNLIDIIEEIEKDDAEE